MATRGFRLADVRQCAAAAAAQDEGEVSVYFGEQAPTVEPAAVVYITSIITVTSTTAGDVDHGRDPGPDRGSRGTGALKKRVDEAGPVGEELARTGPPVLAQARGLGSPVVPVSLSVNPCHSLFASVTT
ncbi:hypothetical protein OIE71_00270 [Streptomyces sp. NBC_01725]|uniref:hypothetical protein n=1 Tax=Streptomyces sp. NBC_01725 TaxID=2975923 RepID=UPI002E2DB991|nr:hypothetical protein [Streptomyces sp. NBC_01725]